MNPKKMISWNRELPLVSILIVAFHPWKYFIQTLRSCLDQTYQNTEILILDNASEEDIGAYFSDITGYTLSDKKENRNESVFTLSENAWAWRTRIVKLIRSDVNLGPYKGLNFLLDRVQWDYIAIQDHDDLWHPEKLEKQVTFLESHPEYIGCGTNTIMYYESDQKYFEYFLWETNSYTIHPSLMFRNTWNFHYDTDGTEYMCDAWSLKTNLCHWKKCIYNLSEPLTLHLIKKWTGNMSYRWHTLSFKNIKRVYQLHPFWYATLTLGWEILRKGLYPLLNFLGQKHSINQIERLPFRIMGKEIRTSRSSDWWSKYID